MRSTFTNCTRLLNLVFSNLRGKVLIVQILKLISGANDTVISREQFDELTAWVRQTPEEWDQVAKSDDSNFSGRFTNQEIDDYISGKSGAVSLN